jgi:hypothetical protein
MVLILLFLAPSDYTALKTVLQTSVARQLIVNTLNVLTGVLNSLALSELHTANGGTVSQKLRDSEVSV